FTLLLRHPAFSAGCLGPHISDGLCMSPCRSDHLIPELKARGSGVWSLRILSDRRSAFPADCPHLMDCHCRQVRGEYQRIHRLFQHIARFVLGTTAVQAIVTAAVYWGFPSERRLAANPSG